MLYPLLTVRIRYEHDTVTVRQRARHIARLLGFDVQDQTRIATAVSEIARNAFRYAGAGKVEYLLDGVNHSEALLIRVSDNGPGIPHLERVLAGRYQSQTGMGVGITGARRLMDDFEITCEPGNGTVVVLKKLLPAQKLGGGDRMAAQIAAELATEKPQDSFSELQLQNQELLRTLDELRQKQEEITRVNRELEDTNRGVVALYAELDEKADHLRRADELKSKFLSNMSHEFRSPLNSILALGKLLLDGTDGELNAEQKQQVDFIRKAATDLYDLVNDLLDLAKVEAGKVEVNPVAFDVSNLFAALRGMLRPLFLNQSVNLVFEDPTGVPTVYSDEGKVSQILRNFISNALKFTERGEVRVTATIADGDHILFSVADTGIGIAKEDQERIFQDFAQVENPIQKRLKGTGLGLPLSRKLAQLLGGEVNVTSDVGVGSTFSAMIPLVYRDQGARPEPKEWIEEPGKIPVLVVDNSEEAMLLYERYLKDSEFQIMPAANLREAHQCLATIKPAAIIADILLRGEQGWNLVIDVKKSATTRDIPVMVASTLEDQRKAYHLGADAYLTKPINPESLLSELRRLTSSEPLDNVLIIDDNDRDRYVLKHWLRGSNVNITEAPNGLEGLAKAREERPALIFLDLCMPEMSGFEVLDRLKSDPATDGISVIINTSMHLNPAEREQLSGRAFAVLSKEEMCREEALELVSRALQYPRME